MYNQNEYNTIQYNKLSTSLSDGITVSINGVDKTTKIDYKTFSLSRIKTSQVDTLNFSLKKIPSGYEPSIEDDVLVYENGTPIFGGVVVKIDKEVKGKNLEIINVQCKDYSFDMDRKMVADTYENQTMDYIINDINTRYMTGFTTANVNAPITVDYIAFNYEYPSKCLQQLAELIDYDWFVDETKDIHFFGKNTQSAPFNLTDTNGKYFYRTLKINSDVKNLRNTIVVRGGQYLGSPVSEQRTANGTQKTFNWAYGYSNYSVTVDGVSKTVGIDFIDDPTLFDCLYNFNEKALIFPTAQTSGDIIEITGNPHIPVIIKLFDPVSVSKYGTFEYKIVDKSIKTKEGARQRAKAEIIGWANEVQDGYFETEQSGLEAGQAIHINSVIRGIDSDFIISKIRTKMVGPSKARHQVTLVTTATYGMIEFLQGLLIKRDKEIVISKDEVVDTIYSTSETLNMSDSVVLSKGNNLVSETISIVETSTVQALNYGVQFVVGPQVPSGTKRQFVLNGSPLS